MCRALGIGEEMISHLEELVLYTCPLIRKSVFLYCQEIHSFAPFEN